MYRLIIADDESNIRDGIKYSLDWEAMGFEIIGSFSDGYEVLECLEYEIPDVIITDIKMKQISGMEVAKFIHTQGLPCKVVLISGFREFELAVEGMKYGVVEYLSKPLNVEKIRETFQKLKADLDQKQYQLERAQKEQLYLEKMRSFLEKQFFEELSLGVLQDTNAIRSRMRLLLPDMDHPRVACVKMDMELLDFEDFLENSWEFGREQLEKSIRELLRGYSGPRAYYYLVSKTRGLLEIIGFSPDFRENGIEQAPEALRQAMAEALGAEIRCQVTRFYPDIYAAERSVFRERSAESDLTSMKERRLLDQKALLLSCTTTGNGAKAKSIFKTILEESQGLPEEVRVKIIGDILEDIHRLFRELESGREPMDPPAQEAQMSLQQMIKYCIRLLDSVQQERKKDCYSAVTIVNNAIDYIERNIYSDISREEVAQKVFVSPSYLSRVFAQETGEGFLQYINRRKIEKSIDFLKDPGIKLYEISAKMGYKTPRYYSRLFQAQMGMTAKDYRIQLLSQNNTKEEGAYVRNKEVSK